MPAPPGVGLFFDFLNFLSPPSFCCFWLIIFPKALFLYTRLASSLAHRRTFVLSSSPFLACGHFHYSSSAPPGVGLPIYSLCYITIFPNSIYFHRLTYIEPCDYFAWFLLYKQNVYKMQTLPRKYEIFQGFGCVLFTKNIVYFLHIK